MTAYGQQNHYVLNGWIHVKNGDTYPYKLSLDVKGTEVYGYSATKLTDGKETRIAITGKLEKEKRVLSISEKKLIGYLPENLSICLVDVVLMLKSQNIKYPLSGNFISKGFANQYCGEGSMEFEASTSLNAMFGIESVACAVKVDTEINPQAGEYEITSGRTRQLEWLSDTCILQIYDGGIVDGDKVTVLLNDKELLTGYELAIQKKQLKFALRKKLNTISIVAEYEGTVPPNTANLILTDGDRQYRIKAFNNAGDRANILLLKK